ncbi:hypothetical protein [Streptomyces sp. NBC_01614]
MEHRPDPADRRMKPAATTEAGRRDPERPALKELLRRMPDA